jgi:hypothetical protein
MSNGLFNRYRTLACKVFAGVGFVFVAVPGCDGGASTPLLPSASLLLPDGIDPATPTEERVTITLDASLIDSIRVEARTARVSISQQESIFGSSVTIKVAKAITKAGLSRETLEALLKQTQVVVKPSFVNQTRLDVRMVPADGLTPTDIVFDILVILSGPLNAEVILGNGPVDVQGLQGNLEIRTATGAIFVDQVKGSLIAKTSEAAIEAREVLGSVQAETSGGEITLRLAPPPLASISAVTSDAPIRLSLPTSFAATLELQTEGGAVSADLAGFALSNVVFSGGRLTAVLNGGGGRVEARTRNADIDIGGL